MNDSPLRVAFLGFALSEDLFAEALHGDPNLAVQTQRFCWAVIGALEASGATVTALSFALVRDFPQNRRLVFRRQTFRTGDTRGSSLGFVNIIGLKHLTRLRTAQRAGRDLARETGFDAVLVMGVNSALLLAGIRLARRERVPAVVILTDPPSIPTVYDNRATLLFKRLDRKLIVTLLKRYSGLVALSPRLATNLAPGRPWILMEGIASPIASRPGDGEPASTVVYAGGLLESYGVRDLLDAVELSQGRWRLEIYGRGPMEAEVQEASRRTDRVVFGGLLDGEQVAAAYGRASLLVNPRRIDVSISEYSFPSKLLEYMASGTPVLTTRMPNIPDDYRSHLIVCDPGAASLSAAIDAAVVQPLADRQQLGEGAREFILATRGREAQGARLRDFISGLREAGS